MAPPPIFFVHRELGSTWPGIADWGEPAVERLHARFRRGIDNWIAQTYLRLKRPLETWGIPVRIVERFPRDAICVAHRDHLNRLGDPLHDGFVIGVRADRPPVRVADLEIVQNPLQLDTPRARLIPHWPQPALVARDPARGARVERVAYLGRTESVPAWYRDRDFHAALARIGIAFEIREEGWNDYSAVDVVLAHRDETPVMLHKKPASKLVNAWLAGVPAVLGSEPAFDQLRESELDFVGTEDAASTLEALRALAASPERYRAMVENGRVRARPFSVESVRGQWLALLRDEAIPAFERWQAEREPRLVRYLRHQALMAAQKWDARAFRREERRARRTAGARRDSDG